MIATKYLALLLLAQLNPLVERAAEPRGAIPDNCVVSDAAPMERLRADAGASIEARTQPAPEATSSVASTHVAELKRALAANDRSSFDAALARARAAGVATRVYDDVARLWDAQFASPFFAEDSDAYRVASSYPGYAEAVRRQIFTDANGRKYYPAAESRSFVAAQAGGRASAPAARTTTTSRTPPRTPAPVPSRKPATRKPAASGTKAPSGSPDPPAVPKSAASEPAPAVSKVVEKPSAQAPPAAGMLATPAPAPIDTVGTGSAISDALATDPTVADTAAGTDTTGTDTTGTETAVTDTSITDLTLSTATDSSATTTPITQPPGRSIVIPAILILIGLGVLVLLFRTKA